MTAMTCASRTSAHAPAFIHFSAINRVSRTRVSTNITGVTIGHVRNLTAAGTGTLVYDPNDFTLTYQAPGDTVGSPLDVSADLQAAKIYSGNGIDWAYIDVDSSALPTGVIGDIVGVWEMQDDAASTTILAGVAGSNGTLTGAGNTSASTVAGPGTRLTKAIALDGTNDYVSLPGNVTITGQSTECVWARRLSTNTIDPLWGTSSGNSYLGLNANTTQMSSRNVVSGSFIGTLTHGVTSTNWNHYARVRKSDGTVDLYINGVLRTADIYSGASAGNILVNMFGRDVNATYAHVELADMRLYATDKSADLPAIVLEKDNTPAPPEYGPVTDTITIASTRSTGVVQPSEVADPGDPDYYSQQYLWNFGDAHAITYTKTNNRNSNTCYPAPNTGHLFTTPGIYTVRMRCIENDGTENDYEETITITDQEDTASIFYCDSSRADDSGNGLTPATAKKTLAALLALRTTNSILKLEQSGSYTVTAKTVISHDSVTITAYRNVAGVDQAPTSRAAVFNNSTDNLFEIGTSADNAKICHLDVTGLDATSVGGVVSLANAGTQTYPLLYDVTATLMQAMFGGGSGNDITSMGEAVVDCRGYDLTGPGTGACVIYTGLSKGAVLGTDCDGCDGQSMRVFGGDEGVVADSRFTRPRSNVDAITIRSVQFPDTLKVSMYWAVLRNYCDNDGAFGSALCITNAGGTYDDRHCHALVFGNDLVSLPGSSFQTEAYRTVFRDNTVTCTSSDGPSITYHTNTPLIKHFWMLNNAVTNLNTNGSNTYAGIVLIGSTTDALDPVGYLSRNNISHKDNASIDFYASRIRNIPVGAVDSDYNLSDVPTNKFTEYYSGDAGTRVTYTLAETQSNLSIDINSVVGDADFVDVSNGDFRLQATSDAIAAGDDDYLGWVRIDADGNLRTGHVDIGPYQYGASAPDFPAAPSGSQQGPVFSPAMSPVVRSSLGTGSLPLAIMGG